MSHDEEIQIAQSREVKVKGRDGLPEHHRVLRLPFLKRVHPRAFRFGFTVSGFLGSDSVWGSVWTDGRMLNASSRACHSVRGLSEAILRALDPDAKPILRISGKRPIRITGPDFMLRGTTGHLNGTFGGVEVKVGGNKFARTEGRIRWHFTIRTLEPGVTKFLVHAYTKTKTRSVPIPFKSLRW